MRLSYCPYALTWEDAGRLIAVLTRRGDSLTVRDLERRHRIWTRVIDAAAAIRIVRIEKRQPHTGRPSLVVVLESHSVNKTRAAKLPFRQDNLRGLSIREESFLAEYWCPRGTPFFGPRGHGSAADAYRKAYGRHRAITPASARSAGARLMRRPWMRAAFYLDRRLMQHGGRLHYPADMHSAGGKWLQLIRNLDRAFIDWPADVGRVIRHASTYPEARDGLAKLERLQPTGARV